MLRHSMNIVQNLEASIILYIGMLSVYIAAISRTLLNKYKNYKEVDISMLIKYVICFFFDSARDSFALLYKKLILNKSIGIGRILFHRNDFATKAETDQRVAAMIINQWSNICLLFCRPCLRFLKHVAQHLFCTIDDASHMRL